MGLTTLASLPLFLRLGVLHLNADCDHCIVNGHLGPDFEVAFDLGVRCASQFPLLVSLLDGNGGGREIEYRPGYLLRLAVCGPR